MFEDGRYFTADGRARFVYEPPKPLQEIPDEHYPYVLLTGRGTSAQWHTQTRTAKSQVLRKMYPENIYVEINPVDAAALGIQPGAPVEVSSRRGSLTAAAFIATSVMPGQVFIPMHYEETNRLTLPVFDAYSRQPSYKHCAVRMAPRACPPGKP